MLPFCRHRGRARQPHGAAAPLASQRRCRMLCLRHGPPPGPYFQLGPFEPGKAYAQMPLKSRVVASCQGRYVIVRRPRVLLLKTKIQKSAAKALIANRPGCLPIEAGFRTTATAVHARRRQPCRGGCRSAEPMMTRAAELMTYGDVESVTNDAVTTSGRRRASAASERRVVAWRFCQAEGALLAGPERTRQALQHHRIQADAGLSHRVRVVRGVSSWLFRLEHAASDHRADHPHGRRGNHRPGRAIQPGRHPAARFHHRCARAPAGIEPLSRDHVQRRRACRQCRPARRGRA